MAIQKILLDDTFAGWQNKSNQVAQEQGDLVRLSDRGIDLLYRRGSGLTINVLSLSTTSVATSSIGAGGTGYKKYDLVEIENASQNKAIFRVNTVNGSGVVSSVTMISTETGFSVATYPTKTTIINELNKLEESKLYRGGDTMTGALDIAANLTVSAGTATISGLVTANGGLTVADGTTFTANGSVNLGNAVGDTVTVAAGAWTFSNATTVAVPSTINFDSNTLVIDGANNRIGINKAVPTVSLDSVGDTLLTTGSNVLSLTSASGLGITGNVTTSGINIFNLVTDSSSSLTGAVIIAGGVGIAKKLYVGTNLTAVTDITSPIHQGSIAASGTLTLKSTSSATKATAGILMTDAIASTSTTTGTLVITGGLGLSGDIFIGGNLNAVGTSNSLGTITSGIWNGTILTPTYGGTGQNFSTGTGYSKFTTGTAALVATIPNGDIATTLSSKTLDNTNTITVKDSLFTLQNATAISKQVVFDLASITAATTRTLTFPDASGTFVLTSLAQTLTNKTLDNTSTLNIKDTLFTLQNATNASKLATFDLSAITAATTRTFTLPDASGTLVLTTGTGATGTWNISISGNAATATNGLVSTGSYVDPAWITSLAKSKVGLGSVENTALSTWAGTANITTLGTISAGTWSGSVISATKGGLGLDFSSATGYVKFTAGTASSSSSIPSADITTTLSNKTLTAATINGATVPTGYVLAIIDEPFVDTSAVNKLYVDTKTAGFQVKITVVGATTSSLNATYNNGSGTLTSNTNSAFPVTDGVTYVLNDRILVKDQNGGATSPPSDLANGIYTLTTVGSGATPWVLTRAPDSDTNAELNNALVTVTGGVAGGGNSYLNSASPVTLGSTLLKFEAAGTSVGAGAGMVKNGSSLDIVGTTNRIVVSSDSIDIGSDVSTISGTETYTGTKTFNTNVKFGTNLTKYSGNVTTAEVTQISLDSYAAATYRSAKYLVQATDSVSGNVHLTELLIIKDNANNVYVTEYGTVISSVALFTATADYDGTTNVRLRITPASVNSTTFRFSCELITL